MSFLPVPWRRAGASIACVGALLVASVVAGGPAVAQTAPAPSPSGTAVLDAQLKKTLETRLEAPIDAINRLPIAGLYEVRAGGEVFYTDATGSYILVGNLIDLRTRENLTRMRVQQIKDASLPPFQFAELPFDESVKIVKGNGKRKVAIFEDPNCGYCKKLEKSILDVGDVTIYVFLYPVLGPDSLAKSKQVWCAADRAKAWNDWMQGATALSGDGACKTPLDRTLALGRKLRVEGTPTLFFPSNKRVEGTIDADTLEKMLANG